MAEDQQSMTDLNKISWFKFNNFIEDIIIANVCDANKIAVDVGCHYGRFTWTMGKLSHSVFAFDPLTDILFKRNYWPELTWTNPDGVDNVVFINCGVSDRYQILTYTEYDDSSWNSLYHGEFKRAKELKVIAEKKIVVIKLDDMISNNVSLLKIDTEGGDLKVLQGATNTIKKSLPIIVVEATTPNNRREIITFLNNHDYDLWHMGWPVNEPTNDEFIGSLNLLAIHKTDTRKEKLLSSINEFIDFSYNQDYDSITNWIRNKIKI
jgi:FkbM family methyltransferase